MPRLTYRQKWNIIETHERTGSFTATALQCNVTRKTVHKWVGTFKRTGDVAVKRRTVTNPLVSESAAARAVELLTSSHPYTASGVAAAIYDERLCSKVVSKSTMIRAVRAHADGKGSPLRVFRRSPKQAVTSAQRQKRLAWCEANKRRSWAHVLFTDRTKFRNKYPGSQVGRIRWGRKGASGDGSNRVVRPTNPLCLNVYAGISKWGVTKFHIVAGS